MRHMDREAPAISGDTSWEALSLQIDAYRRLSPAARVDMTIRLSEDVREIALAGIRQRHPQYSPGQARRALYLLLYGEELVQAVWPTQPPLTP